jgi:hypothetical protein
MSPTCPPKPSSAAIEGEPIIGRFSFQHIVHIIGWVCFGITVIFCMGLCILHFSHYRAPNEQRNVFRIIIFPVVASLAAVISIYSYSASGYIEPIASLYEAIALASLFLLYVQYVAPEESTRVAFFRQLEYKTKNGSVKPLQHYKLFRVCLPSCVFLARPKAQANLTLSGRLDHRLLLRSRLHHSRHRTGSHTGNWRLL